MTSLYDVDDVYIIWVLPVFPFDNSKALYYIYPIK